MQYRAERNSATVWGGGLGLGKKRVFPKCTIRTITISELTLFTSQNVPRRPPPPLAGCTLGSQLPFCGPGFRRTPVPMLPVTDAPLVPCIPHVLAAFGRTLRPCSPFCPYATGRATVRFLHNLSRRWVHRRAAYIASSISDRTEASDRDLPRE